MSSSSDASWEDPVSGQYIPPGGSRPYQAGPPPSPPKRNRGNSAPWASRRSTMWIAIGIAVVALLVRTHHISTTAIIELGILIPSIILHEISHGVVALAFGDDTAKRAGRLTLNPIRHVDPVGTLIVPALVALGGFGFFGWAKPVPVNLQRLRNPRNNGVWVSLAGPTTNIVLAAIALVAFRATHAVTPLLEGAVWAQILFYLGAINLGLAVFNLLPIPPLDGSVLLERAMPRSWWPGYLRWRQYAMPIVLGLVLLNFYLHPGPITWLFNEILTLWGHLTGIL